MCAQITSTPGSMSIRHRPDGKIWDRCLNDIEPKLFVIWMQEQSSKSNQNANDPIQYGVRIGPQWWQNERLTTVSEGFVCWKHELVCKETSLWSAVNDLLVTREALPYNFYITIIFLYFRSWKISMMTTFTVTEYTATSLIWSYILR